MSKLSDILKKNATYAKTYIANALTAKQDKLTFDTTPTADSQNPVTSDGIKKAIDAKTVDLSGYQTKLTFDSTPTANSSNPVTSDGVKSYVDNLSDSVWHNSKELSSTDNLDDIKKEGIYYQSKFIENKTTLNYPPASSSQCTLLVFRIGTQSDAKYIQLFCPVDPINSSGKNYYYHRTYRSIFGNSGTWSSWLSSEYASTATKLATARTISLMGDASGSVTFDGSGDVSINTTVAQATKATQDASGNIIADTYAKKTDLSNYYTKTQVDTAITNAISAIVDGDSNSY